MERRSKRGVDFPRGICTKGGWQSTVEKVHQCLLNLAPQKHSFMNSVLQNVLVVHGETHTLIKSLYLHNYIFNVGV